jgi:hypothetical protein
VPARSLAAFVALVTLSEPAAAAAAEHGAHVLDADTAANKVLFDRVQEATFRYFWEGANQASGMALEGSGTTDGHGANVVTVGGSGFGVAAIVVAASRGWVTRAEAVERLLKITHFLALAHEVNDPIAHAGYHGAWSHWLNADPAEFAKTIPFGDQDDGGDLVETADMIQGLLVAQSYFDADGGAEARLRFEIAELCQKVDWRWYASSGDGLLRWHWSPTHGFWDPADPVGKGWNEALNVYVLGASSPEPSHRVTPQVYEATWLDQSFSGEHVSEGYVLHFLPAAGGPLFFAHYSFLGLDPRLMQDKYDNYWRHNVTHTLSNRAYAIYSAPREYQYGDEIWGLTASQGAPLASQPAASCSYGAWAPPPGPDSGTIAPTAALSSFPYTPYYSMQVLHWLAEKADRKIFGRFGFHDAFNLSKGWYSSEYLAIDQGPIVCMMENYRSGLLWRLLSSRSDIRAGMSRLGINQPDYDTGFYLAVPEAKSGAVELIKHIETGTYQLDVNIKEPGRYALTIDTVDGATALALWEERPMPSGMSVVDFDHGLHKGRYRAHLKGGAADKTLDIVLH